MFGIGYVPLIISNLKCIGTEGSILDCDNDLYGITQCSMATVAGVQCEGTTIIHVHVHVQYMYMYNTCIVNVVVIDYEYHYNNCLLWLCLIMIIS